MPIVEFVREEHPERVEEPFNVGIILSGGQAPGGHNVVSGIFDGIKSLNKENRLYGFLMGPAGFINHQYMELTAGYIKDFRNTGGFDIIGSGQAESARAVSIFITFFMMRLAAFLEYPALRIWATIIF